MAGLSEITEEFYDSMFDTNVKGVLFTVQKALPVLADGASIILSASIVAKQVAYLRTPFMLRKQGWRSVRLLEL